MLQNSVKSINESEEEYLVMKKLFIGNCDFELDETALQSFIETHGVQVSSVQVIRDKFTGRSRGFGFAELSWDAHQNTARIRCGRP